MNKKNPSIDIEDTLFEDALSSIDPEPNNTPSKSLDESPPMPSDQTAAASETLETSNTETDASKEKEYYERLLRVTADFDNFRKRTQKEKSDLLKYGNERLVLDILPVMDNFERALSSSDQSDAKSILDGVHMIFNQLNQALGKHGLKQESAMHKMFDPNLHEAMTQIPNNEHPPGTVVTEHNKMSFLNEKLIRPSLVGIACEVKPESKAADLEPEKTDEPSSTE